MMEPAAPGTEDDIKPTLPSSLNKKESEQERLLSVTARLPTGKLGSVFELSFHNGSEHWYCNLCECPIMGRVYHHEIGKRHTNNMQGAGTHLEHHTSEPEPIMHIAPGEPVPPGFEGEMGKVAQIQERLDSFTVGPLIGLEYLFELIEYDREKEPLYLCLLCDKRGDPRTVIAHLASYNHIIQYTQRHFVTCSRALSPYITKQYKRNWQATMQKIAEAIEQKFGRLKPLVVEREIFEAKRAHYQNLVAAGPHFNERSGVTFEELIDKEQLTKSIVDEVTIAKLSEDVGKRAYRKTGTEPGAEEKKKRSPSPPVVAKPKKPKPDPAKGERRRSLSSVSSISSSDLSDFEPSKHLLPEKKPQQFILTEKSSMPRKFVPHFNRGTLKKVGQQRSRSRSISPYKGYGDKFRGRPLHPWQRSDYIRSRTDSSAERNKQKSDKMEEYKKLSMAIETDMDRILKQHEKNPEKHPQYNEEWKKFWNRRYKELQTEGKDAASYDFKPEWIDFWNKRMGEIHNHEVKTKKDALRKRLALPEEPVPISFKISGKKKQIQKEDSKDLTKLKPMASTPDQDPDVIVIEDKDEDTISSKRSHSPWETEPVSHPTSRRSRDHSRSRERAYYSREKSKERLHNRDRSRSRTPDRKRGWGGRNRELERDYHKEVTREKGYYRDAYRKSELPEYLKPPRVLRDVTRHPVVTPPPQMPEPEEEPEDDGQVNMVAILRLLTALEEKLGSLGPKIIDLLTQALALEKAEANSSETLLDNDVNCVLFETVKEKLKGQLLAHLVDYNQEKAFKNAIKKIASLVHFANERSRQKQKEKPQVDPIKVPGVGTVDKAAIAKQIATALVLQGKTDVSQDELEQLINAVVGMAEASRNSNKPMTTATFLQQLTQKKSVPPSQPIVGALTSALQVSSTESTASNTTSMEGLSDSDLQTLLQNFKDLCTDEQHSLISYLKKLEAKEPERVERLRKFVNLDATNSSTNGGTTEKVSEISSEPVGRTSPFSARLAGVNPMIEEKKGKMNIGSDETSVKEEKPHIKVSLDSDDEDYTFEDVFKAAKKNVKEKEEKELEKKIANPMMFKTEDFDLSNAKSLIANIMGQFKAKNETPESSKSLLGMTATNVQKVEVSGFDNFPINLTNLANAVNTAHKTQMELNSPSPHPQIQPRPFNYQVAAGHSSSLQNHGKNDLAASQKNYMPQPVAYPQQNPYLNNQPYGGGTAGVNFEQTNFDRSQFERPNFDRPNFDRPNFERFQSYGDDNRDVLGNQNSANRSRAGHQDTYGHRW